MNKEKISRNFCFLDLETTGFEPTKDSIIEISFVVRNPAGKEIDRFDQVVYPDKSELSAFVSNLTGITQEEINQSGKKFAELVPIVNEKIGDAVIVGHNIDFDINFLLANGLENLAENPRIDTHELARIALVNEESYALEVLSDKYGISHENAHRAMSDVEANIVFFDFLVEEIRKIPAKFLPEIKNVLENKTDWFAKYLFLQEIGKNNEMLDKTKSFSETSNKEELNIPAEFWEKFENISAENTLFINQFDNQKSAELAKKIAEKTTSALIISPKLEYFSEIKQFPAPNVILDPEKLEHFANTRERLNNDEITFWLQAKYRHFLKFRGKKYFNLFLHQRDFWDEVCLENAESKLFQEIIAEKADIQTLAIHPQTFFQLIDLDIFKKRTLIIDESEVFANNLLFSAIQDWSFLPVLNSADEQEATSAQFWITSFCREIIEQTLSRPLGVFPEKVLLEKNNSYSVFANNLQNMPSLQNQAGLREILKNPPDKTVRWASYFPQSGDLKIGAWHPDDWREIKNKLAKFPKIFLHRQKNINWDFFKTFVGVSAGEILEIASLKNQIKLNIPDDLVSVKSPDFAPFCLEKIAENFDEITEKSTLAVNFSSLETLRKAYDELSIKYPDNLVVGEGVSGGVAKMFKLLTKNPAKKSIVLFKNITSPEFTKVEVEKLIIQKFLFLPPQPLLEEFEKVMKTAGLSFWETWVMPQTTAFLSRITGNFPKLKEVIFLDARENSRWGKNILKNIF